MKQATERKLNSILNNCLLGNKKDAAQAIRKLNKIELVLLLTQQSQLDVSWDAVNRIKFEDFVLTALETK